MTAPDETPGPGAPKKAARTAKAPAKKQAATKKATPRKAAAKKAATPAAAGAAEEGHPGPAPGGNVRHEVHPARDSARQGARPRRGDRRGRAFGRLVRLLAGRGRLGRGRRGEEGVPREKTCGDGLTPRAVRQLADMDLEGALAGSHRYGGLRAFGFGRSIDMHWPEHPNFPNYGYTITRHDLDGLVAGHAEAAGATLLQGTEVTGPVVDEAAAPSGPLPTLTGVTVKEKGSASTRTIKARYVVVADGSNSRIGRMLGTSRRRELPMGMALRGYYRSDRHDDPFIESHLDIRDAEGNVVPGYGWIFPMGDGRVNVGVGLLSTDQRWKGLNTSHLMDAFVDFAPASWGIRPETSLGPPTGGKLPMGLSVGPRAGGNVADHGRRRRRHQPVQRRGHRLRLRDREAGRGRPGPRPDRRGRARPDRLRPRADGGLRPVLQGGTGLRAPDLEP